MPPIRFLDTIPIFNKDIAKNKRILMRVDLDVPIINGIIQEDFRIRANMPSLRLALSSGHGIRLIAHLGRPKGIRADALSLKRIASYLERLMRRKIILIRDPFDEKTFQLYYDAREVLLFENIRFWKGEEANDKAFAEALARWGDIYVNEAFASCHRAHASVAALAQLIPAYAGVRLIKELQNLGSLAQNPPHPFVAILGGAKLETKLPLIIRLVRQADTVLVGGALANTILSVRGFSVGKSLVDDNVALRSHRALASKKIILPEDVIILSAFTSSSRARVASCADVRSDDFIADIGPKTALRFAQLAARAATIVWNGPLGVAEFSQCRQGTKIVAKAIADSRALSMVGGGDTISAFDKVGLSHRKFSFVSTGGGAMLEFLSGKKLPGVEALKR